jgi:hypothetical protein
MPTPIARADQRPRGGWGAPILFGIWVVGISIPLASLTAQHGLPFARRAPTAPAPREASTPRARHILAADCACSGAVADRLATRRVPPSTEEVWIVGADPPWRPALERAGYAVRTASADGVTARFGVVGAPFLIAYDATGRERYAGGYAPRRPRLASDVQVEAIVAGTLAGSPLPPFPAYGCIVGETLRKQADPGRLAYDPPGAGS